MKLKKGVMCMYMNPYYPNQVNIERIDGQIKELENMRRHYQNQQPVFNQTLQLAPNTAGLRFADNIENVYKELVLTDSVFLSRDYKTMWLKDVKGGVRTFNIKEVVSKDEKDLEIESLKEEIEKLKKEKKDEKSDTSVDGVFAEPTKE